MKTLDTYSQATLNAMRSAGYSVPQYGVYTDGHGKGRWTRIVAKGHLVVILDIWEAIEIFVSRSVNSSQRIERRTVVEGSTPEEVAKIVLDYLEQVS